MRMEAAFKAGEMRIRPRRGYFLMISSMLNPVFLGGPAAAAPKGRFATSASSAPLELAPSLDRMTKTCGFVKFTSSRLTVIDRLSVPDGSVSHAAMSCRSESRSSGYGRPLAGRIVYVEEVAEVEDS